MPGTRWDLPRGAERQSSSPIYFRRYHARQNPDTAIAEERARLRAAGMRRQFGRPQGFDRWESVEMIHHIVNMKTGAESMYRVIPVNGTSEKIQHIAGLHPRHAEVRLPHAMINRMASAVKSQSRRDIGQEILQELCNGFCPTCVRNAMDSLLSCSTVVDPAGKCFGCGESCGA